MLLNFYRFWGFPRGWQVGGWGGGGHGCVGGVTCTHAHTCMQTHTHMHARTHARTCMLNMINMDASMLAAICNFYTCVYVRVHASTCMCMCVVTPPPPRSPPDTPPPTCPLPRATGSPKHQNSISLELIEIFRFFLNVLYL